MSINFENPPRKQYPSETLTDDVQHLQTQIRVFKRWLNSQLKQANAIEITDVLDIFRDTKNLYFLCKHLLGQKVISMNDVLSDNMSQLDRAIAILERLYGHEIATVMQTAVVEISSRPSWDSEAFLRDTTVPDQTDYRYNHLQIGLDTIWILIVTVRAGTGPPTNLGASINSSSGSTITRRSSGAQSAGQLLAGTLTSTRTPCVDRWLISQDERLLAWCVAITEGYEGVSISNFNHSWRDGLALLAIVNQSRPELFTYTTRLDKTARQNLALAFHLATAEFATPRLLELQDMHIDHVDPRATAVYLCELRKAIERDRKRRSRGILEIQTATMAQGHTPTESEDVNVTVLNRSSPTSTASVGSDVTWLDDEFGDEDDEEGDDGNAEPGTDGPQPLLPDPAIFDQSIETTLAWLLAMEEQFSKNDLIKIDHLTGQQQQLEQFNWAKYASGELRQKLHQASFLTMEERTDVDTLLTARGERLKKLHTKILSRLDEAMRQFEVHEDLTAHLSRRQMSVGKCLRLGNRVIHSCRDRAKLQADQSALKNLGKIDGDREEQQRRRGALLKCDADVMQRQTTLLATRWNNLCRITQAMGRRITGWLLRRQGMLLIAIRLQLEDLESERTRQADLPIGPSIPEVKSQLEVNRELEEGIEIGEVLAERLDNFVMLVPPRPTGSVSNDASADEGRSVGLESIITDLATRWGRLVEWVNTRYAKLQNALLHWRHFDEEASLLSDWLGEREDEVVSVSRAATASEVGQSARGSRHTSVEPLGSSRASSLRRGSGLDRMSMDEEGDDIDDLKARLDSNEAEMEAIEACINNHEPRWAQMLASLDRRAQSLREACGDSEHISRLVESTVDHLVSRWSQLVEPQLSVDDWVNRCVKEVDFVVVEPEKPGTEIQKPHGDGELLDIVNVSIERLSTEEQLDRPKGSPRTGNRSPALEHLTALKTARVNAETGPPPSPTGYRIEFEVKAEELLTWLENSAAALEMVTMDDRRALELTTQVVGRTAPSAEEPREQVINRVAAEAVEWRETMKKVLTMGERYREELLQVGENVDELDQLFDDVGDRWGDIQSLLAEAERQVRVAENRVHFHEEVAKLLNRPPSTEGDVKLNTTTATATPLPAAATFPDKMDAGMAEPVTVIKAIESKSIPVVHVTPPDNTSEQISKTLQLLNIQLSHLDQIIEKPVQFTNPDDIDDQLGNLNQLLKELKEEQSRFSLQTNAFQSELSSNPEKLEELQTVGKRLSTSVDALKQRVDLVQDLNEQMEFFMNQLEGIEKWLSDMRDYLDSVSQAVLPSITVIKAQLQESCEALVDMDTLEPTLNKVTDVARRLLVHFDQAFNKTLTNRLDWVHDNWTQVRQLTRSNRKHLEQRLTEKHTTITQPGRKSGDTVSSTVSSPVGAEKTPSSKATPPITTVTDTAVSAKTLKVDLDELKRWMTEGKEKLGRFTLITSKVDLKEMEHTIQTLEEEISKKRYILAALDTHSAVSLTEQVLSGTDSLLTRAHFADLESALGAERERLRAAKYHLEDFNTVLSAEKRWLDSIDAFIHRIDSENYADISDLVDDLESLDRLSDEHSPEDEERLESLVGLLTDAHIQASIVQSELMDYGVKLTAALGEISRSKSAVKSTLDRIQRAETRAAEWTERLKLLEPQLREYANGRTSGKVPLDEWRQQTREAELFLTDLKRQIDESVHSKQPGKGLLMKKLKMLENKFQEPLKPVQNLITRLSQPSDLETRLLKVERSMDMTEKRMTEIDVASIKPADIHANKDKAKELLSTLNAIQADLRHDETTDPGADQSSLFGGDRHASLNERHHQAVMAVLVALDRLEKVTPVSERLQQLMTSLTEQVAGVEEVTDYLETADCPTSRKDMVQRVHTSLQRMCDQEGLVDQIRQTMAQLTSSLSTEKSKSSVEPQLSEISAKLEQVQAMEVSFRAQMDQIQSTVDAKSNERLFPTEDGVKLSTSQLISTLLSVDTSVSDELRELARQIRDHLKTVVLFNRLCLQSGSDFKDTTTDMVSSVDNSEQVLQRIAKETSIAERKVMVEYFGKQRTWLGDRLRELTVNAGGDGSTNRLQDLLALQNVWQEANEKLDHRGEQTALLMQQLNTTETAITDYLHERTDSQLARCGQLINQLEDTYGWKLTTDRQRLTRTPTEPSVTLPRETNVDGWLFEERALNQFDTTLRNITQYLNEMHWHLDRCRGNQLADLDDSVSLLEQYLINCYQSTSDAQEMLISLTNEADRQASASMTSSIDSRPDASTQWYTDQLLWLKLLLDTQRYRLEKYAEQFKLNRGYWQQRAEQWRLFHTQNEQIRSMVAELHHFEMATPNSVEMRKKLQYACDHFNDMRSVGLGLLQTDLTDSSEQTVVHRWPPAPTDARPPAVPPRRNSLHRGEHTGPAELDRAKVQRELNLLQSELHDMCQRHASVDLLRFDDSTRIGRSRSVEEQPSIRQTYINMDWMDESGMYVPPGALDTIGNYRAELEACIQGLRDTTNWFVNKSSLVPPSLLKRKSDDILLSNTMRSRPTTAAELSLDWCFWHGIPPNQLEMGIERGRSIEFTPAWLKAKWSELESLIEVTFEHEKQANVWCRKASHLIRLLREGNNNTGGPNTKGIISCLETGCHKASEAVNTAQAALRRRDTDLARWQSQLVDLDTTLAEIKTLMSSYEATGFPVRTDISSEWLASLRTHLGGPVHNSSEQQAREHWLAELDPQQTQGLGASLDKLAETWIQVQDELSSAEQATLMMCVPKHIASQVEALLQEWDILRDMLQLPPRDVNLNQSRQKQSMATVTVINAPIPTVVPSVELVQSAIPTNRHSYNGHVTPSTAIARIRNDVDQLSHWLTAVTQFTVESTVRLGDRFDQETVNQQLQHANKTTSEGPPVDHEKQQPYHPAALQLKIKQFLTELDARKPQLERICVEKDRLGAWEKGESAWSNELSKQAEQLPQFYDVAESRMQQRVVQLEVMMADIEQVREMERELDRWFRKTEAELESLHEWPSSAMPTEVRGSNGELTTDSPRRWPVSPDSRRKRIQEINDGLPEVTERFDRYSLEAEAVISRYSTEDTSILQNELERMNERWAQVNDKIKQANKPVHTAVSYDDLPVTDSDPCLAIGARVAPKVTSSPVGPNATATAIGEEEADPGVRDSVAERLEAIELQVARIGQLEYQLTFNAGDSMLASGQQRNRLITELQNLQLEINSLSNKLSNPDVSSRPEGEFLERWRQLREKVAKLRQNVQTNPIQDNQFLSRLKQLNDWVAHQDAAFRGVICPLNGNLLFVIRVYESVGTLFKELDSQRDSIEDAVCQGRALYGDERSEPNLTSLGDSEFESDGSEMGRRVDQQRSRDTTPQANRNGDPLAPSARDNATANRVVRRIRKYLYHLNRRWLALTTNMLEYKHELESLCERLSNFQSMFNDAVEQVRSAHSVTIRWSPVDCIPIDQLSVEFEQAQSFYEACDPLTVLLNSLERQIAQFQDAQISIEPSVVTQQAMVRNDFDQVRLLTETRLAALNEALRSLQTMDQRGMVTHLSPIVRASPMGQYTSISSGGVPVTMTVPSVSHTNGMDPSRWIGDPELVRPVHMTNAATMLSTASPYGEQYAGTPVSLSESVSSPWERGVVNPSGNQVPYYKNHYTQETQWDHPILSDLLKSMEKLNKIRFSDYRTALKLRKIQRELCMDALSMSLLTEHFKDIGHSQPIEGPSFEPFDRTINVPQMLDILLRLFQQATQNTQMSKKEPANTRASAAGTAFPGPGGVNSTYRTSSPGLKSSTLPAQVHLDDLNGRPASSTSRTARQSPTKCGARGFRRHSSVQRDQRASLLMSPGADRGLASPTGPAFNTTDASCTTADANRGGPLAAVRLNAGNRSSSLPESVTLNTTGPVPPAATTEANRPLLTGGRRLQASMRGKRQYRLNPTKHPVNVCVDMTLNWLLNVHDRMRKGSIRALSFKVALTVLSVSNLDEKYRYLFSLIADSRGLVTERSFSALMQECILIPRNLGECESIGKEDFTTLVKLCFSQIVDIARSTEAYNQTTTHSRDGDGVPMLHCLTWLRFNPPVLMWLPLLHRVMLAEQVVHHVRCGACQNQPLIGLRYRCLRCLNFDLCQDCFFSARTARSHKLTHPMQEYCSNSTSGESFRDFTRIVRNRFRSRDRVLQPSSDIHNQLLDPSTPTRSRGRSRCCDISPMVEDKPRPAPTFGSNLASLMRPGRSSVPGQPNRSFDTANRDFDNRSATPRTPNRVMTPQGQQAGQVHFRPQLPPSTINGQTFLPPRAASEQQRPVNAPGYTWAQMNHPAGQGQMPMHTDRNGTGASREGDEEHALIAHYSHELRQQSEPDLNPSQPLFLTNTAPPINPLMNRSTISDGLPSTSTKNGQDYGDHTSTMIDSSIPTHYSLDRRRHGRSPQRNGFTPSMGEMIQQQHQQQQQHAPRPLFVTGRQNSADLSVMNRGYGMSPLTSVTGTVGVASSPTASQFTPRQMMMTPSGHQQVNSIPYDQNGPQLHRTYSLRARSQPPPMDPLRLHSSTRAVGSGVGWRGPAVPSTGSPVTTTWLPPGTNFASSEDQEEVLRLMEDEQRQAAGMYDRWNSTRNSHGVSARLQAQQQAQQRFSRMHLQHQMEAANWSRAYGPRQPLIRPPSLDLPTSGAHDVYPGGLNASNWQHYAGSLGRTPVSQHHSSNGFTQPRMTGAFGSEPRVTLYPAPYTSATGPPEMTVTPTEMPATSPMPGDNVQEARLLRQHHGRLELRMLQLEDKNKQLEQKLLRLRQYIVSGTTTPMNNTVTTAGNPAQVSIQPASKTFGEQGQAGSKSSLRQRSASGGLAAQTALMSNGRSFSGSGSAGQLAAPNGSSFTEFKQPGRRTPNMNDGQTAGSQRSFSDTRPLASVGVISNAGAGFHPNDGLPHIAGSIPSHRL